MLIQTRSLLLLLASVAVAVAIPVGTAPGSCSCFYDGAMHACNFSPFRNRPDQPDHRCVCGPTLADWRCPVSAGSCPSVADPTKCNPGTPTPAPSPPPSPPPSGPTCNGQSSCSYDGLICPATKYGNYGCGFYCNGASGTIFLTDQCRPRNEFAAMAMANLTTTGAATVKCHVGQYMKCPNSETFCAGDQCCPDGSTCPSASRDFVPGCHKPKESHCTKALCHVGEYVKCPNSNTMCMGDQCCPDGSTCPSASKDFVSGCHKPKESDCTGALCEVREYVKCPNSTTMCAGDQCCPDGSTCPSASKNLMPGCHKPKESDCTQRKAGNR